MKTIIFVIACALQSLPAAAQERKGAAPKAAAEVGGQKAAPAAQEQKSGAPRIIVEIGALREVKEKKDGKTVTRLEPAGKADSGETIVYSVAYRNEGDAPAKKAVITDPLPRGVVCLPKTAVSPEAETEFSADGGGTWGKLPLVKKEKDAAGKIVEKPVPDSAITHVRWTLKKDLPPGASGEIKFKVKVK